ncbi:glycosyltransferase family 4 protein [Synechococcus moorigangaii CMS01]|nr:glycosyltransferase family 4 protein [Synechococcus moorigangaii CMS01]
MCIRDSYGPYHFARLEAFHRLCIKNNWQAIGIEFARAEKTYNWRTNFDELPHYFISLNKDKVLEDISFSTLAQQIFTCLKKLDSDVIVLSGYFHPGMLVALFWAKIYGKTTVLLSVSKEDDSPRIYWKEFIKKVLISTYDAALVGGKPQKRYLHKLGFKKQAIFCGHNVVDNQIYNPKNIAKLPNPLPDVPYFLSVNRFVPKKNLINLLKAYAKYHSEFLDNAWHLVLCGDGELRHQIEDLIKQFRLEGFVHLPGFLQQNELLPYFAHAGCFVHSSTQEQWGLVVNEAMASGLPVLVSKRCGCFEDLIIEKVNGFSFDPENIEELSNLLKIITSKEVNLEEMGSNALKHIQFFSPDYFAYSLSRAISYAREV